ncbi:hypothetical protein CDAR_227461 [Caerostris darwini]|uniref:Uncharacterized protein n=1 Tax=Caerostris darwini TaxID=1538125 RepID=A0AAV4UM61_9ARAC|nr:hypothetical protein CDAR_227461 [Caerostris darwini]
MIPPDIIFRVIRQFAHLLVRENKRYPQKEMRYALLACKTLLVNNCAPPLLENKRYPQEEMRYALLAAKHSS